MPKFCSLMNMTSNSKNVKLVRFISCNYILDILIKPTAKYNERKRKDKKKKKKKGKKLFFFFFFFLRLSYIFTTLICV